MSLWNLTDCIHKEREKNTRDAVPRERGVLHRSALTVKLRCRQRIERARQSAVLLKYRVCLASSLDDNDRSITEKSLQTVRRKASA